MAYQLNISVMMLTALRIAARKPSAMLLPKITPLQFSSEHYKHPMYADSEHPNMA